MIKKLKKITPISILLLILVVFIVPFFPVKENVRAAEESVIDYKTNGLKLVGSDFHFDSSTFIGDEFTPFDQDFVSRLPGKSWSPKLTTIVTEGFGEHKYIDDEIISFSNPIQLDLSQKSLFFWIYFSADAPKQHTFYLAVDENNYLKWEISPTAMISLFRKSSPSVIDQTVYGPSASSQIDNIPYSWNLVELPISVASTVGVVNGQSEFIGFGVGQSIEQPAQASVLVYDVYVSGATGAVLKNHSAQDNVIYKIFPSKINDTRKYYAGEIFDKIPTFEQLFNNSSSTESGYFWIGKTDFSKYTEFSQCEKFFSVKITNSSGSINSSLGGSGINSLTAGNYIVSYNIYPNASSDIGKISASDEIVFYWYDFSVGNYGQGIWFIESELNAKVGETYTIRYKIHDAFYEEQFMNEVSVKIQDEKVVELIEHDKSRHTITVKVIGIGNSNISLSLTSDRLSPAYTEGSILENSVFVIKAKAEAKKSNTVEIMLWVSLGVIIAVGLGFGIKSIISARKIEVK